MTVLFINHSQKQCGIYQYGKRLSDILKTDDRYDFHYIECNNANEFLSKINHLSYDFIIYNWYGSTMGWLNNNIIKSFKQNVKQLWIYHEGTYPNHLSIDGVIMTDLSENIELKQFSIPRPIYEINLPKIQNDKLTFGSFGFGFHNKGFEKICNVVNQNFKDSIIHLHITNAFFGDKDGHLSKTIIDKCHSLMVNTTNELLITSDFYTNDALLNFLNSNTVNIFLYDNMVGRGLSSVIDYAISVNTPLIVNNSYMFRHLLSDKPNISIDNNGIENIINEGLVNLHFFREKWSHSNLKNKFIEILRKI